ncbi:MFS transporter [Solwaraspora sp. WMMA2065]|uniref:MFS transporter n=1 Tax=Solwaraspora sp. WMMA2065 TaxID=3015166 RepID=UPI00259B80B2|nr:MFS transporter [Solwaraspora sp. WMMA2065]WJK34656.1 MFS transporter [Solwaraspora sp. WMMA2065]
MNLTPYRQALALPGVARLLALSVLARMPNTAAGVALTLYVVLDQGRGYGAAGLAGTALTVGAAIGAPVLGRLVDRRGLRPVLAVSAAAQGVFWAVAQALPYPALLVAAVVAGLLSLPVFSVIRQSLAALVPAEQRRPAYALDSMSVELSFMVGPALAVLLATAVSPRIAMVAVGAGLVAAGLALFVVDPPIRARHEEADRAGVRITRRDWLTPQLLGVLAVGTASTLVLGGTDVALIAALRESDQLVWTSVVLAGWGAYSLVGGFAYGATRRAVPPVGLMVALAAATVPVGLGAGNWWTLGLALAPAGLLCAPTIAATSDAVARLAPAAVRGEAMGLHGSAMTVGMAVGAPLTGAVIDASTPTWGFVAIGAAGLLLALPMVAMQLRRRAMLDRVPACGDGLPEARRGPGRNAPGAAS